MRNVMKGATTKGIPKAKGIGAMPIGAPRMLPHAVPSGIGIKSASVIAGPFSSQISLRGRGLSIDDNPRRGHCSRTATQPHLLSLTPRRTRDPFLRRNLQLEFQEIVPII